MSEDDDRDYGAEELESMAEYEASADARREGFEAGYRAGLEAAKGGGPEDIESAFRSWCVAQGYSAEG